MSSKPSESTLAASSRRLQDYRKGDYTPGASILTQGMWYFVSMLFFESGLLPMSSLKSLLLRAFGAKVGKGVVIKSHVRIKYPWHLTLGDYSWIGQGVWIDNLADVLIEDNVCISQEVYFCTGAHDRKLSTFDLITKPIVVRHGAWIAARATVLPGMTIGAMAVVCAGSVIAHDVLARDMVGGVPARSIS